MNKIVWNHSYETGVQEIDEQHRKLLDSINWFEEEIIAGEDYNHLINIVKDIYFSFKGHFANEQIELKIISHPELSDRKEYHQKFLAEVSSHIEAMKSTKSFEACYECYDYIYTWFFTHLVEKESNLYQHKIAS